MTVRDLLVIAACLIALMIGIELVMTLLRALAQFVGRVVDTAAALIFMLLIAPLLWVWHAGRRPMWRTLTKEQTRELESWLRRGAGHRR